MPVELEETTTYVPYVYVYMVTDTRPDAARGWNREVLCDSHVTFRKQQGMSVRRIDVAGREMCVLCRLQREKRVEPLIAYTGDGQSGPHSIRNHTDPTLIRVYDPENPEFVGWARLSSVQFDVEVGAQ